MKDKVLKYFWEDSRYRADLIGKLLNKNKEKKILDVGCGKGYLMQALKENGFDNVCGIEITGVEVELKNDFKIDFYDGNQLPYADGEFYIVCSKYVLHHAHDKTKLLSEIIRISNGYVVIVDEYVENIFQQFILSFWDISLNLFGNSKMEFHLDSYFKYGALERMMNDFGLEILHKHEKKQKGINAQMIIAKKI